VKADAYADLVLVDGNPLEDIKLIVDPAKNFKVIMKDGKIYKKHALRHGCRDAQRCLLWVISGHRMADHTSALPSKADFFAIETDVRKVPTAENQVCFERRNCL
jgi:hypothetical protein